MARSKLNVRQIELLKSFKESHVEGMLSEYREPFGIGRLQLGGEGMPMTGLIRRELVRERNNIFYITDAGLAALSKAPPVLPIDGEM